MTTTRHLRVLVDHAKCVGSTICVQTTPAVFALDENRQSMVVDPAGDTVERIKQAAEGCPLSAIIVEDADTGETLFP